MTDLSGKKPKVLVADDDEDLLMLMKIEMKAEGFDVQISPNGDGIFNMVEDDRPDIIFLDIHMNGIDGGEICRDLKTGKTTKDIPVIIFSANQNIKQIARECGADACLAKPFSIRTVRQIVSKVIGRERA